MIRPNSKIEAHVSCVEEGRWTEVSENFRSEGTQLFSRARQSNTQEVSKNYAARPSMGAVSNQTKVWSDVAAKRARLSVASESGAMHDAYRKYDKSVNDYVKHFETSKDQVGALFAINGKIIGVDIFDQNKTLKLLFPKIVKSYALDAIEEQKAASKHSISQESARSFIRLALAKGVTISDYASAGEGRDVRITSKTINGASLVTSGRPVHIALFAPEVKSQIPPKQAPTRNNIQQRGR